MQKKKKKPNYFPPLSEKLCFSSCLFKAPPPEELVCSNWSAHTRLTQQHTPCLRSALSCFQLPVSFPSIVNIWCKFVTWWCSVMSQSYRIEVHFRSSLSCGRKELLLAWIFNFFFFSLFLAQTQNGSPKNKNVSLAPQGFHILGNKHDSDSGSNCLEPGWRLEVFNGLKTRAFADGQMHLCLSPTVHPELCFYASEKLQGWIHLFMVYCML